MVKVYVWGNWTKCPVAIPWFSWIHPHPRTVHLNIGMHIVNISMKAGAAMKPVHFLMFQDFNFWVRWNYRYDNANLWSIESCSPWKDHICTVQVLINRMDHIFMARRPYMDCQAISQITAISLSCRPLYSWARQIPGRHQSWVWMRAHDECPNSAHTVGVLPMTLGLAVWCAGNLDVYLTNVCAQTRYFVRVASLPRKRDARSRHFLQKNIMVSAHFSSQPR